MILGEEYWDWPLQDNDGIVKELNFFAAYDSNLLYTDHGVFLVLLKRVINNAEKFEVGLEAKTFLPNEIQVRVISGLLEIHFERKKKKDDYGNIYRTITRSYRLPEDIDIRTLKSHLSSKGKLHISAKKLADY